MWAQKRDVGGVCWFDLLSTLQLSVLIQGLGDPIHSCSTLLTLLCFVFLLF